MSTLQWSIAGLFILIVGLFAYNAYRRKSKDEKDLKEGKKKNVENGKSLPGEKTVFPLERGDEYDEVKTVQKYIKIYDDEGFWEEPTMVDGIFGEQTETRYNTLMGSKKVSNGTFEETIKPAVIGQNWI